MDEFDMIDEFLTDELCALRELARASGLYTVSDHVRNILDSRGSFVIDTKDGQVVYHMGNGWDRPKFLKNIKEIDLEFEFNRRFAK